MLIKNKICKYCKNSDYRFVINEGIGLYKKYDDVTFTIRKFKTKMGYDLNLELPLTFNEKLQWLKLFDHNPIYTKMVDKVGAKEYVANIIGEEYIIPTIGVWDRPEDIDWDKLPNQFVLKVTHDSGGLIICKNKANLDKKAAIKKLNKSLNYDYYNLHREWPYKNVPRKIIVEKYMQDNSSDVLKDYKFYCFNGEPLFLYVSETMPNYQGRRLSFITMDWEVAPFGCPDYKQLNKIPERPNNFDELKEISRKLAEGHPFIRVDLYSINGKIYFGELTFYPFAGMMRFEPREYDKIIGELLILPPDKMGIEYEKTK